jgi:hypothetical protein
MEDDDHVDEEIGNKRSGTTWPVSELIQARRELGLEVISSKGSHGFPSPS